MLFFRQVRRTQCPVCSGNGKEIINACNRCGGSGQDTKEQIIDFTIPKNLMTGQVYTFRGMGEEIGNGHPGDLQIQVVVSRHEQFKVSDKDLIYEPEITILDILLGRILEVPYFGTYLNTTIPQCSSPTTTFKINGKGLERGDGTSGDILVKPKIIMPNRLTPQEQQILRNLNNSENFIKTI